MTHSTRRPPPLLGTSSGARRRAVETRVNAFLDHRNELSDPPAGWGGARPRTCWSGRWPTPGGWRGVLCEPLDDARIGQPTGSYMGSAKGHPLTGSALAGHPSSRAPRTAACNANRCVGSRGYSRRTRDERRRPGRARRAVAFAAAPGHLCRRPLRGLLAMAGVRPSLFSAEPLRRLVEANLGYQEMLDARVELHQGPAACFSLSERRSLWVGRWRVDLLHRGRPGTARVDDYPGTGP